MNVPFEKPQQFVQGGRFVILNATAFKWGTALKQYFKHPIFLYRKCMLKEERKKEVSFTYFTSSIFMCKERNNVKQTNVK